MWQQHKPYSVLPELSKFPLTGNIPHKKACSILEICNLYFDEETKPVLGSWRSLVMFDNNYFTALLTLVWSIQRSQAFCSWWGEEGVVPPKGCDSERATEILLEKQWLLHSSSDVPHNLRTVPWGMSMKKQKSFVWFNCKTASCYSHSSVSCSFALSLNHH